MPYGDGLFAGENGDLKQSFLNEKRKMWRKRVASIGGRWRGGNR